MRTTESAITEGSELLDGLLREEPAAWETLAVTLDRPVSYLARRHGLSSAEAQDARQDAWLVFLRKWREEEYEQARGDVRSWLAGIACRVLLEHARRRRSTAARRRSLSDTALRARASAEPAPTGSRETTFFRPDETVSRSLERVRAEVAPRTWEMFDELTRRGRSAKDVARRHGVLPTTAYNAKHRVLERLRELLRPSDPARACGSA